MIGWLGRVKNFESRNLHLYTGDECGYFGDKNFTIDFDTPRNKKYCTEIIFILCPIRHAGCYDIPCDFRRDTIKNFRWAGVDGRNNFRMVRSEFI